MSEEPTSVARRVRWYSARREEKRGHGHPPLIAGTFGLGIKVSEDGPISIYDDQGLLVKL